MAGTLSSVRFPNRLVPISVSDLGDLRLIEQHGGEGVGLFRTELLAIDGDRIVAVFWLTRPIAIEVHEAVHPTYSVDGCHAVAPGITAAQYHQ